LIAALKDANPAVRISASDALGEIKDPRAVVPLKAALADKDDDVRKWAAAALGNFKDSDVTGYSCHQDSQPPDAIGTKIEGEGTGAIIGLYDENTRSRVGSFSFNGGLWFFDGGKSTEVEAGTRVLDFSFGDYHPGGPMTLSICASGKYFILSSEGRRFRIHFPSVTFAAFILEIK
jgi:hypothetical protein